MGKFGTIFKEMKVQSGVITICLLVCCWMLLVRPAIFTRQEAEIASVCLMTISLWATGVIPPHLTSLCFFLVCLVFSLARPETVFSGFTSSAVWLIFGGLVIGAAITTTGLGRRVGRWIAARLHGSYLKIITGLVAGSICFSFLMPSAMGRVVLLIPIAIAIADYFGFEKGRRGRTGIVLAVIVGSFLPAFSILPANVPNMVLIGMSEKLYHISLFYGPYLLLHFPVLGLLKGLVIILLIVKLFPDTPEINDSPEKEGAGGLTRDEKILTLTLLALLILWMTDFIHHVSPAWVALAGAIFLMFPGVAIVDKKTFNQKINWASIIFVAGIIGLGSVINESGTGHRIASHIIALLPLEPGHSFINFISLSLAAAVTAVATTLPAMPAVFTQFSDILANASGFSLHGVINLQVLGFSTVLFPYQAPPIVVGIQLSEERFASAAKLCFALALITLLILFPLDYLWWRIIGVL